jgi:serine phosphatase RsbU (regulator of sigma subunit)/anti-sigma regulatory factor (Ser/Thr protein kinase)
VRDDLSTSGGDRRSAGWKPYALAIGAVFVAIAVTGLLIPLADDVLFSPLVGTVVLVSVFYGAGPALAATAVGWLTALVALVEPRGSLGWESVSEATQWGVGLAVALVLIWASWTLQRLREQETRRAKEAEETTAVARELHELAAALASAATPAEVAGALLARVPELLGSVGGSLGLVEGDQLAVVDPVGGPRPALRPGLRLPLSTRAPITTAARTGEAAYAVTREQFVREFPDGARLARYAASALAVPLRVDGRVAGSIGFPFTRPQAVDDNVISLARIAAELGGQALERSLAYERERALRDGLERVTRLVPRFAGQPPGAVVEAICSEAREMFEADVAQLWKVADGRLEVLWREPPDDDTPPGHVVEPRDYPGMQRSLERLDTTFFPDARATVSGEALERVLAEGVRSVLRVPIVVAGRPELMLALRWSRVVPDPSPQMLALVRRFADHAGLVIEQGERRRAEETEQVARARAERLAGDLAQLHVLATALGAAATTSEVATLVAERVLAVAGADTAAVFDVGAGGRLELLASVSSDSELARQGQPAQPLLAAHDEAAVPAAPVWSDDGRSPASASIPLLVEGSPVGLLVAKFGSGRVPDDATRRLVETIAGHAAQPLERARLHESEHAARVQAELSARRTRRLQALTAAFAGALTPAEVAATFLDETFEAVGAAAAALAVLDDEGRELQAVRTRDFPSALLGPEGLVPVEASGPAAAALRLQEPSYHDDLEVLLAEHPPLRAALIESELRSFAFLPVSAGAAPLGVAVLAWTQPGRLVDDERAFLEAVAAQCGLALDRARRYEGERVVAETLQRSVLPETVPSMEGVRVAALYLPGSTAVDVGGDWFDTLTLPDGRLGFVVGDVVGKGVQAAATMAQLRNGMRALTLDAMTPAQTVTKLNLLLENYIDVPFATLAYLALDPETLTVTLASAGHPPPLVVGPNGRTRFLEGEGGLPLGVDTAAGYTEHTAVLEPGSILVLYTDGLVERRGRSIDDGLARLARAAESAPREPDAFVDALVAELLGSEARQDDVALLAILLDPVLLAPLELTIPSDPESLPYLRGELERWLDSAAVPDVDARDILLAAWEAGANAIEHADAGEGAFVQFDAALSGDRVRIGVVDRGRWKEPEARHDRGLGLRLIEALMTTVDVERGPGGTRIVMERPLTREPARGHGSHPAEH